LVLLLLLLLQQSSRKASRCGQLQRMCLEGIEGGNVVQNPTLLLLRLLLSIVRLLLLPGTSTVTLYIVTHPSLGNDFKA
jgi:hypothetical protein